MWSDVSFIVITLLTHGGLSHIAPSNLVEEAEGYYEGDMIDVYDLGCNCIPRYPEPPFTMPPPKPVEGGDDQPAPPGEMAYSGNKVAVAIGAIDTEKNAHPPPRNVLSSPPRNLGTKWPGGVVPFQFVPELNRDEQQSIVMDVLSAIQQGSDGCVSFIPYDGTQSSYVAIVMPEQTPDECASHVGMQPQWKQPQRVVLGPKCFKKKNPPDLAGVVLHEMMHTLGFYHEHTRPDRDEYLDVFWNAIKPSKLEFFNTYIPENQTNVRVNEPFDVESIMLVNCYSFSNEPSWLVTMMPRNYGDPNKQIGQRQFLSEGDKAKLRTMYCPGPHGDNSPFKKT